MEKKKKYLVRTIYFLVRTKYYRAHEIVFCANEKVFSSFLVHTRKLPVHQVGSGAQRRRPFHCRLLCLCGEMAVHTLFEIYFKLRLHLGTFWPGVESYLFKHRIRKTEESVNQSALIYEFLSVSLTVSAAHSCFIEGKPPSLYEISAAPVACTTKQDLLFTIHS